MEEIPWLSSTDLVEEDDPSSTASAGYDSLRPIELEVDDLLEEDAPQTAPRTSSRRMLFAALGAATAALAGVLVYTHAPEPPAAKPHAAAQAVIAPAMIAPAVIVNEAPAPTLVAQVAPPEPPAAAAQPQTVPTQRIDKNGASVDSAMRAGFASLNHGDARDALRRARAVVEKSPKRADAWLLLGSAYDALHDRPNAQSAFQSCALHAKGPTVATCKMLARQ